jgi:predicted RNA binding protein YcfA (HicA-like mRNA interferase family)
MKVRDLIKKIEADGWRIRNTVGSHRQYVHPTKNGKVTVPGHMGDDVNKKTLNSILNQAGLKP